MTILSAGTDAMAPDAQPARLCFGRVPADFRPGVDIAFDPTCFVGVEQDWPGWDDLPFQDAYDDAGMLWDEWTKVRAAANGYVDQLACTLNVRHGTDYGQEYWRELLLLWLLLLIQAARVRDVALGKIVAQHGSRAIVVEIPVGATWSFTDDLDFMDRAVRDPLFDAWLCGRLIRRHLPASWSVREYPLPPSAAARAKRERPRYPVIRSRFDSIPGAGRFAHLASALLHVRPASRPARLLSSQRAAIAPDAVFDRDFLGVLDAVIRITMPHVLTDGFAEHDRAAKKLSYRAGKITVTTATKYRTENRFVLAHAKEAGERIFRVQHGSGYGMARAMIAQEIEYFDSGFVSWGWRSDDLTAQDAVQLPSPMLSQLPKWETAGDDLIMITTNVELSPHPFKGGPYSAQWLQYRKWKSTFVNALPAAARAALIYRPRFNARNDLEDLSVLERNAGKVRILSGNLDAATSKCRLSVIDHPGTATHVLMAMGVPTVMFWQRDIWPQHPQADAAFDALRDCGILFHDPAAAARHIGSVFDDPARWWNGDAVRAARTQWTQLFARNDPSWRRQWLAWLRGL